MSVPLSRAGPVMPGEEVDVAVEMAAPTELGRYLGYWRLMGPRGRKFGQRVWAHVQVVDPKTEQEPLGQEELTRVLADIESKKNDDEKGNESDDGSVVMVEEPSLELKPEAAEAVSSSPSSSTVEATLRSMGFDDETLLR